ncbi:alkaline phosphatase family protein [Nocardioides sp. TRM66260-LWL]|uniref:alkaline phosphatase family protein n=1 Tax=Nocardioides sp. TRM66260-LWL TaxID=2874478 RepID=UPI001CC3C5D7|nr:alkaline phosphatase family protein [Nocardioides sp. TRM66260-LWL]MBZ5735005.1 alkaline phosphatase family protein [Nocardioides sp. TRM66260-LWL]
MCTESRRPEGAESPFEAGAREIRAGRRTVVAGAAAAAAGLVFSTDAVAGAATSGGRAVAKPSTRTRVYVLVIDGCRPAEISPLLTPNLHALKSGGLNLPRARSLPIMETIPNHVMMMSGVRPDRTGVPANSVYDRAEKVVRDLDRPTDLKAVTVIERLRKAGFRTGTVLSKDYLYGIFGTRAGQRWEPAPLLPITNHAPDLFTMQAALAMLQDYDPHLMFVNLGDIDRFGHADLTGTTLQVARRLALADTDVQVGRFVQAVKDAGHWDDAVVCVLADHSMDWSLPNRFVSLSPVFAADPLLAGNVVIADNGGADLCYWTGPAAQRDAAVQRMIALATPVDGVLAAYDRRDLSLRLGANAGEVVVYCHAGWRFSDPSSTSNPIPGNHGHPATAPIPFFLGGGHRRVPKGRASVRQAFTFDVAAIVADAFGMSTIQYEGRSHLA